MKVEGSILELLELLRLTRNCASNSIDGTLSLSRSDKEKECE